MTTEAPATAAAEVPVCAAMSRPLVPGKPSSFMICTQDAGHKSYLHTSCDGRGRVLASWLRLPGEQFWHSGDCEPHDHGRQP